MAEKHDAAWVLSTSGDLREKYVRGEYRPNSDELRALADKRLQALRRSLLAAAVVVGGAAVLGVVAGLLLQVCCGPLAAFASNIWQAIAVGVILWATLWQLSRGLQSFGGESLPERVHGWIFNSLYTLGTFILFVVYGWQA